MCLSVQPSCRLRMLQRYTSNYAKSPSNAGAMPPTHSRPPHQLSSERGPKLSRLAAAKHMAIRARSRLQRTKWKPLWMHSPTTCVSILIWTSLALACRQRQDARSLEAWQLFSLNTPAPIWPHPVLTVKPTIWWSQTTRNSVVAACLVRQSAVAGDELKALLNGKKLKSTWKHYD